MSIASIFYNGTKTRAAFEDGTRLFDLLLRCSVPIEAPCGGNGRCGKCIVMLDRGQGFAPVKACITRIEKDCRILVPQNDGAIRWNDAPAPEGFEPGRKGLGAAVDLGTTTLAVSLFDLENGRFLGTASEWNAQRVYGADVISRISYIRQHDGLPELCRCIRIQIRQIAERLCSQVGRSSRELSEIFVSGNTVMEHICAGIDPVSIAFAPFKPKTLFAEDASFDMDGIPVYFAPCLSAYVGGDISCGILALGLDEMPGTHLLLDAGTNGEMVLGGADGLICCSAACGPAFEGAGIRCGMPAADGAVYAAEQSPEGIRCKVLGGGSARGICGSGLLDLAACLLKEEMLSPSGRLLTEEEGSPLYRISPDVCLCAADIRQLQLAKAAVAAGIRVLTEQGGASPGDIFLSGGFGTGLDPESAMAVGMLPRISGSVIPAGNSSLQGAQMCLLQPSLRKKLTQISHRCRTIELSVSDRFKELFIEELSFGKE